MKHLFAFVALVLAMALPYKLKAQEKYDLREEILQQLPASLQKLDSSVTEGQLKKRFAKKIIRSAPDALYLAYFQKKANDVTIGLLNGKLDYLLIDPPSALKRQGKTLYRKAVEALSDKEKERVLEEFQNQKHGGGRELNIELKEQGLILKFADEEDHELRSIIIRPKVGAP